MRSSGGGNRGRRLRRGTLVLVVGPSGAGKDSIIAGAAALMQSESRLVFARRLITRPAEAGGEDHIALSPEEFAERRDAGELLLHWQAHGLEYGLPGELATAMQSGLCVVANVSRSVVAEARRLYQPTAAVAITAPVAVLAARLAARGRETATDIEARLQRQGAIAPTDADAVIENDGPLDIAVHRFAAFLRDRLR